jgi:hypothetical protein
MSPGSSTPAFPPGPAPSPVLVDPHVHIYPCFRLEGFLDGAIRNLERSAGRLDPLRRARFALCLTEGAGHRAFDRLLRQEGSRDGSRWEFRPTGEAISLLARRDDGRELWLVAGRQIETRERLEVSALCCTGEVPDGLSLDETVERARTLDAVVGIPWGFGKWWFGRGRVLRSYLAGPAAAGLFLGDNSGRPRLAREPRLLAVGRRRGLPILPGSDPLPLPAQEGNAGRYGFVLPDRLDPLRPGSDLRNRLRRMVGQPEVFGRRESLLGFLRSQSALQLRRFRRGHPGADR